MPKVIWGWVVVCDGRQQGTGFLDERPKKMDMWFDVYVDVPTEDSQWHEWHLSFLFVYHHGLLASTMSFFPPDQKKALTHCIGEKGDDWLVDWQYRG